ncbi:MAG: DUF2892 domain-containing protein [Nitrospirae bacterium]|nr:MAG: DUF2892 domain-containing protein [Nitrospirota bacterium]
MALERITRTLSGTFILITLFLSQYHTRDWLYMTFLIGLSLFQSGIIDWCPIMGILRTLGVKTICEIYYEEVKNRQTIMSSHG